MASNDNDNLQSTTSAFAIPRRAEGGIVYRLQFSLRGMLVFVAAVACTIGFCTNRCRRQRAAFYAIRGLDAHFELADADAAEFSFWNDKQACRVFAADLWGTEANDSHLETIAALPNLRKLVVYGTRITQAGLTRYRSLRTAVERHVTDTLDAPWGVDFAGVPLCQAMRKISLVGRIDVLVDVPAGEEPVVVFSTQRDTKLRDIFDALMPGIGFRWEATSTGILVKVDERANH